MRTLIMIATLAALAGCADPGSRPGNPYFCHFCRGAQPLPGVYTPPTYGPHGFSHYGRAGRR
jgi:hypothetical protein